MGRLLSLNLTPGRWIINSLGIRSSPGASTFWGGGGNSTAFFFFFPFFSQDVPLEFSTTSGVSFVPLPLPCLSSKINDNPLTLGVRATFSICSQLASLSLCRLPPLPKPPASPTALLPLTLSPGAAQKHRCFHPVFPAPGYFPNVLLCARSGEGETKCFHSKPSGSGLVSSRGPQTF